MAYTPPVGTVDLTLTGAYTPPVGTVDLSLGAGSDDDRSLILSGVTPTPLGQINALTGRLATLNGLTPVPTGLLLISPPALVGIEGLTPTPLGQLIVQEVRSVLISGLTLPPLGLINTDYDPNLLSDTTALTGESWSTGQRLVPGVNQPWTAARQETCFTPTYWQPARSEGVSPDLGWKAAQSQMGQGQTVWQMADRQATASVPVWQDSGRQENSTQSVWQTGTLIVVQGGADWLDLPLLPTGRASHWQEGHVLLRDYAEGFSDGQRLIAVEIEVWQQAGYSLNADNPRKDDPETPIRPPWGTHLRLVCGLPGTRLSLRRTACVIIPERELTRRRTYMTVNSASLVRLPDLTPLPCTSLTVETDFDSWCWALTATLKGDAWDLVKPNPLACEVLATINGFEWKFLLDVPNQSRQFNQQRIAIKGRSRSAWLHKPYQMNVDRRETQARELVQLAEAALVNTGWTLDWQLENWLVPAGRYNSLNTPIGVLIRLVNVTDDGLYTHPHLQVIEAVKRWPVASWLLDGATVDLAIPDSALINLSQSPVYTQPLNGVYLSGTSHGVLAFVRIDRTAGDLQPDEVFVEELLCDENGVAARQRGLNILSNSGAGYELTGELLFLPELGLIRPGMIVSIAGVKGITRSLRINAQWQGDGLSVHQTVGMERREVED